MFSLYDLKDPTRANASLSRYVENARADGLTHLCFDRLWQKTAHVSGDYRDGDKLARLTAAHCGAQPDAPDAQPHALFLLRRKGQNRYIDEGSVAFMNRTVPQRLGLPVRTFSYDPRVHTFCDQTLALWNAHVVIYTHGGESGNVPFQRPGAWGAIELTLGACGFEKVCDEKHPLLPPPLVSGRTSLGKPLPESAVAALSQQRGGGGGASTRDGDFDSYMHLNRMISAHIGRRMVSLRVMYVAKIVRSMNTSTRCSSIFLDTGCRQLVHEGFFDGALRHYSAEILASVNQPPSYVFAGPDSIL